MAGIRSRLLPQLLNNGIRRSYVTVKSKREKANEPKTHEERMREMYGFPEPQKIDWKRAERRRNVTISALVCLTVGLYFYTFYAVKQETFLDVPPLAIKEPPKDTGQS